MGQVFRARHTRLNREVALKMISTEAAQDPRIVSRFRREVKLLCQLSHPHIVPVFDGGTIAGRHYFAMELVEGRNILEILQDGAGPSLRQAIDWLRQIGDAVAYLHGQRLIHRDVKPQNIILTRKGDLDHIVLVDFGLARTTTSAALTRPGEIVGTIGYLAPEVLDGEIGSFAVDVWAFGVTAFRLLAQQPLFREQTTGDLVHAIIRFDLEQVETRERFDDALAACSPEIRDLVAGCLRRDPASRLPAADIHARLESLAVPETPAPGPSRMAPGPDPAKASPPRKASPPALQAVSHRRRQAVVSLVLGLGLTLAALLLRKQNPAVDPQLDRVEQPAHSRATPGLPVNFVALSSEKSVLVDFELPDAEWVQVRLKGPGSPEKGWTHRTPDGIKVFHHLFRDLRSSSRHLLSIEDDQGRIRADGLEFWTQWEKLAKNRREKYAALSVGIGTDVTLRYMEKTRDPEAIAALVHYLRSPNVEMAYLPRIARLATWFRHPELTTTVLERGASVPGEPMKAALLHSVAATRLTTMREEARAWIEETKHPGLLAACAKVLEIEGRRESFARLSGRLEFTGSAAPSREALLDAMIRCDRDRARETFITWIAASAGRDERALAAAWGIARLGDPDELDHVVKIFETGGSSEIVGAASCILADSGDPRFREVLAARLSRSDHAGVIWSAARAGVTVIPVASPGDAPPDASSLAREAACGLQPSCPQPMLDLVRSRLTGPAGWRRDVATWLAAQWREGLWAKVLEERAFAPGEDPSGLALWARTRMKSPPPPAGFIARIFEELETRKDIPLLRACLLYLAAREVDVLRAGKCLPTREGDPEAQEFIESMTVNLGPFREENEPGTSLVPFVTMGVHQRTGWWMRRGESISVRGFGFRGTGRDRTDWARYGSEENLPVVLRHGRQEWGLAGRRTFIAEQDGEVLIAPGPRLELGREPLVEAPTPGLLFLSVGRIPGDPPSPR